MTLYRESQDLHTAPSQRMRLEEAGFSAPTAFDFDRAVRLFGGTVDAKLAETEQVEVEDGEKPRKGHHFERRPRYTLAELLTPPNPEPDDGELPDVFADLPAALLLDQ